MKDMAGSGIMGAIEIDALHGFLDKSGDGLISWSEFEKGVLAGYKPMA